MNELIFSSTINIFFNFPYYPAVRFYHLSGTVFFFSASKIHSAKSAHACQKMKMEPSFRSCSLSNFDAHFVKSLSIFKGSTPLELAIWVSKTWVN